MKVIKRDGSYQSISFDKVMSRLKSLTEMEPKLLLDYSVIAQKVISQIFDGIHTRELDELSANICTSYATKNPKYGELASRIIISNNHKNTPDTFSECVKTLYDNYDLKNKHIPLISDDIYRIVNENEELINNKIMNEWDYNFDYFAYKTLEKSYLLKKNKVTIERIQYLIMRVALGLHNDNFDKVFLTYQLIANKYFIHATPTLFNSGTNFPQLLSCFLLGMDDSVTGIFKCLADCAQISKWAGGIGVHISNVRGNGSVIRSTNGKTSGISPMLKVYNDTARFINQSGKRNGSIAFYIEPWHTDIFEFLDLKKNHGDEDVRARDLFYGLWIPDLFMNRVINNEKWSLFCPDECYELKNKYGEEFEKQYIEYEKNKKYKKQVDAQYLWQQILTSQIETGTPYLCYKDASNKKSNQKNIGVINSSNLCTEIIEYSDDKEYACCTLGSIGLSKFVEEKPLKNIRIYSKTNCIFCTYVKEYLNDREIKYDNIIIDNYDERTNFYKEISNIENKEVNSVPQIYVDKKYIGGFTDFMKYITPTFNYNKLFEVSKLLTYNLNKIIDINFYPVIETRLSNQKHRPLGIGVQGLADVYLKMKYSFDSEEAKEMNKKIFATIYYASLIESNNISKERYDDCYKLNKYLNDNCITIPELYNKDFEIRNNMFDKEFEVDNDNMNILYHKLKYNKYERDLSSYFGSYSSIEKSPIINGEFQFDMWNKEPLKEVDGLKLDWDNLRSEIKKYGIRNSLLLAPMPTASTSQILGNNECIEPYTSNIYRRSTLAGEFVIINPYLLKDLIRLELWNDDMKDKLLINNGSIANISEIPDYFKNIYKTAWDLSQKALIDQAADRGIYVCQSQSLNLFLSNPDFSKLSSMNFYAWKQGLKTGIYYLRIQTVLSAQQFTINPDKVCESCSG